jgi:altronate dehydratase
MSLLEIAKLPTAENSAILLHPSDNVVVARVPLSPGQTLSVGGQQVTVRDAIPAGHKTALRPIHAGEEIVRYGQVMGRASTSIQPGDHVHTQNVAYEELVRAYDFPAVDNPVPAAPRDVPTFLGYAREDGRAGTRNYIAVVAASNCAAHTADHRSQLRRRDASPECRRRCRISAR